MKDLKLMNNLWKLIAVEVWNEGDKLGDGRGVRRSPACLMSRTGLFEGFSMSCKDFLAAYANNKYCNIEFLGTC